MVAALGRRGVAVEAVELPLAGRPADIAAARVAIDRAGNGCVVVGHSYGGQVITEAASGLPVARLVFLAAFMTEPAEDTTALLAGSRLMESVRVDEVGVHVDRDAAPQVFYGDAGAEVAAAAAARLRPQRLMASRASEVLKWPTDHSPFLTRPEAIADLIVGHLADT